MSRTNGKKTHTHTLTLLIVMQGHQTRNKTNMLGSTLQLNRARLIIIHDTSVINLYTIKAYYSLELEESCKIVNGEEK